MPEEFITPFQSFGNDAMVGRNVGGRSYQWEAQKNRFCINHAICPINHLVWLVSGAGCVENMLDTYPKGRFSMKRPCILCDDLATSSEHLWPALFGGMRTNPNIYCQMHNNALGPYVAELQKFLALFNAQLDVLPDGRQVPTPAVMTSSNGSEKLLASGSELHPHVDIPELVANLQSGKANLPLTSVEQRERFTRGAKKAGWKIDVVGTSERQEYSHGPLSTKLEFGTDESFRAGAYLALTFFAYHFPLQARADGLAEVKLMLRAGDAYSGKDRIDDGSHRDFSRFAWWTPVQEKFSSANPFDFGHTVAVCQVDGSAYGYVSFFDVAHYGFRLAEGLPGEDVAAVTFIDPLQREQPNEWQEQKGLQFRFFPGPERSGIRSEAFGTQMVERLSALLARILDRQQSLRDEEFASAVNAERANGEAAIDIVVGRQVARRKQEVFNLLRGFAQNPSHLPLPGFQGFLSACVACDVSSLDRLSREGSSVMSASLDTLAQAIRCEANLRPLDAGFVGEVLRGRRGCGIILKEVIDQLPSWVVETHHLISSVATSGLDDMEGSDFGEPPTM